ncbi:hypothetical protein BJ508DRAFT_358426 [Ascobolus immersus RN42]|uniref:Long chronological lifespan protein 2 n=1 Tax=Ascobolus immersus RN42 TaxID=1160509 RepID=A0A3N4INN6_ASCIM|nr:hypothetical protein BJ508DRAFT_358426 [Ascobolus immersus RN42]
MRFSTALPIITLSFLLPIQVSAQFGSFFEQMFHGGGGHHQQQQRNVPSDANWYKQHYEGASCDKYLCPGTLSCVDKPTHCPCAWDETEEKVELDKDGLAICVSRKLKKGKDGKVKKGKKGVEVASREKVVEAMRKGWL